MLSADHRIVVALRYYRDMSLGLNAVIAGQVTEGWLAGAIVEGQYTQGTCTHSGLTTTCFSGTLTILRGTDVDE